MGAELPICQYPSCQKVRRAMSLIGEAADHWVFGCYHCGCARVITKPRTREAAQYAVQMQRRAQAETLDRSMGAKKTFVFLRS